MRLINNTNDTNNENNCIENKDANVITYDQTEIVVGRSKYNKQNNEFSIQ